MRRYISYIRYLVLHKWFVLVEGRRLGVPLWRLLMHDLSKLLPGEFLPYARHFYNPDGSKRGKFADPAFDIAWLKHKSRNRHHWEWWVYWENGEPVAIPMPEQVMLEMVADWRAVSRFYGTDPGEWFTKNKDNIILAKSTGYRVALKLGVLREAVIHWDL